MLAAAMRVRSAVSSLICALAHATTNPKPSKTMPHRVRNEDFSVEIFNGAVSSCAYCFLLAAQVTVIETAVLILSFSLTLRAQSGSGVIEDQD